MEFDIDVRLTHRVIEETERMIHNLRAGLGDNANEEANAEGPKSGLPIRCCGTPLKLK